MKTCQTRPASGPRRQFLGQMVGGAGLLMLGSHVDAAINEASRGLAAGGERARAFHTALRGGLGSPDATGLRLPAGFSARVVARSGDALGASGYTWHRSPDGGACFVAPDRGWIYVSNAETPDSGGVGAIRFAADGTITDAYPILSGTRINCAGGRTPWNTWLSCEEHDAGLVWECDPFKPGNGIARPGLGTFAHEACCVDPRGRHVYLTEDRGDDSGLYRFTPTRYPDLSAGVLEIAELDGDPLAGRARVRWHRLPNPNPGERDVACRRQVEAAHEFRRGEGMFFHDGTVWFTTTADHRVWAYRCRDATITVAYDPSARERDGRDAPLRKPDNLTVGGDGLIYVAEDGDDLQIVMLSSAGDALPLLQLVGHDSSEIAGPAFSPDGSRLYFSSQRGMGRNGASGLTYEVSGPFPAARG